MQASKAAVASNEARAGQCVAGCGWCAFPSRQRRTAASQPPCSSPPTPAGAKAWPNTKPSRQPVMCCDGARVRVGDDRRLAIRAAARERPSRRRVDARPTRSCSSGAHDPPRSARWRRTTAAPHGVVASLTRRHEERRAAMSGAGPRARATERTPAVHGARIAKSAPKSRTSVYRFISFRLLLQSEKMPGPALVRVPACELLCCGAPRALTCGAEQATRRSARMAVQQIPVQRRPAWRVGAAGPIFAALPPHTEKMAARSGQRRAKPAGLRRRACLCLASSPRS